MKITDVRAYVLSIPIREKEFPAPWSWGKFSQVIVEVKTDEEITGYGESFGYGAPEADQPSVVKVGGITEFRKIAALAEAYNVKMFPTPPTSGPVCWPRPT